MGDSAENIRIGTNWLKNIPLGLDRLRQNSWRVRFCISAKIYLCRDRREIKPGFDH
jgi:hypothetical protein